MVECFFVCDLVEFFEVRIVYFYFGDVSVSCSFNSNLHITRVLREYSAPFCSNSVGFKTKILCYSVIHFIAIPVVNTVLWQVTTYYALFYVGRIVRPHVPVCVSVYVSSFRITHLKLKSAKSYAPKEFLRKTHVNCSIGYLIAGLS
jgi:hypothetical protein